MSEANAAFYRHDYGAALRTWLTLARRGNVDAQASVGEVYALGEGVPQDYVESLRWYRRAASRGNAKAERSLGVMYDAGKGVAQNYAEALYWYSKAARHGDARAQHLLGEMYSTGKGVTSDNLAAYMWFSIAASSTETIRDDSAKARDSIAVHLTPMELTQAQEMARGCQQSNFRRCANSEATPDSSSTNSVPMQVDAGVNVLPVKINDALTLNFVIDSGASDVSIPADVVLTLFRTNTVTEGDFLGTQEYTLADGSKVPSPKFRIRSLKVGDLVLHDVDANVGDVKSTPLLGQSFLGRFKSWSIDNARHALVLEPLATTSSADSEPQASETLSPESRGTSENSGVAAAEQQSAVRTPDATSATASFNCSKVEYIAERTVCNSSVLSALDADYADKWTSVVRGLRAKRIHGTYLEVRGRARDFLKQRNQCNDSTECITQAYQDIIQYLSSLLSTQQ